MEKNSLRGLLLLSIIPLCAIVAEAKGLSGQWVDTDTGDYTLDFNAKPPTLSTVDEGCEIKKITSDAKGYQLSLWCGSDGAPANAAKARVVPDGDKLKLYLFGENEPTLMKASHW